MEAYPIKTNKFNGTHLLISKPYQRNSGEMDRQPTKVHVRASTRSNHTSQAINIVSTRRLLLARVNLGVGILYMCPAALAGPQVERNEAEVFRTKKLNSGVRFQDIIEGEGLEAREGDLVEFNYVCRRSNGYFVHSTVDQFSGESNPVVLPLDEKQIIKGLKEVLVGMKVGGKRRASVPPNVGYINEDLKPIPDEFGPRRSLLSHANETLIFEVQLLKVL